MPPTKRHLSVVPSSPSRSCHSHKLGLARPSARRLAAGRVRRLRCELGLTQAEAAALCGVAERSWRDWELGRVAMRPLEAIVVLEGMAQEKQEKQEKAA